MTEARQPTLSELSTEIAVMTTDLQVFVAARDLIRKRVQDEIDFPVQGRLLPTIAEWSGTSGVLGCLDLAVHALERTLAELQQQRKQLGSPARGHLQLIHGEGP